MLLLLLFCIFIIGLFVGSFLNVLADRLPRNEDVLVSRSYCEKCKHLLNALDLVPIFSFILLIGKCRYCRTKLSIFYPLSELLTGILFVITFISIFNFQFSIFNEFMITPYSLLTLIYALTIVSCLIVIFLADIKYQIIPDKILLFAAIATGIWITINNFFHDSYFIIHYSILNNFATAIGAFIFFLLIFLATRGRGMGFGDVKFAFLIGLILGFPLAIFSFYLAFLTGAFVSVILILTGKKKLKKSTIAFGPFLVFGTLICLHWGPIVTDFFLKILHFK